MKSNTISILITAKDLASRRIQHLTRGVGTLKKRLASASMVGLKLGTVLGGLAGGISAQKIIKTGAQYEHAMNTVRYVSRATTKEFAAMDAQAKKLGESTEWSASQAADGLLFLNRAGFGAAKSIAALPGVLDLATAGNIDLGRAADIASNVLSAMRMEVDQLTDVNDMFVATINTSNTDMEMLAESFKYAASVGAGFGYQLRTISGLVGLLGNNGIQGSMAGTQLAHAFTHAHKVFERYGVSAKKADGASRDLVDAIELLEQRGASAQEVMELFGERSGRAVTALMGSGSEAIRAYLESLEDVKDEATRVANGMRDDLAGDYKQFLSVTEAITVSIAEKNNSFMRAFLQGLTNSLRDGKGDIVQWADGVVETVWKVFKAFLVGAGEAYDTLQPVLTSIAEGMERIWDGFRMLPGWVQEVGLVGAFVGGIRGKIILAGISYLLNSLMTTYTAIRAWMDDKVSLGEIAFTNHEELEAVLKERGIIKENKFDPMFEKNGEGAGERWAKGFVGGVDKNVEEARKRFASQLGDDEKAGAKTPSTRSPRGNVPMGGSSELVGHIPAAKQAEAELRRFRAEQTVVLAELDRLLAQSLIAVDDYYAKRRAAAAKTAEKDIAAARAAGESEMARLLAEAKEEPSRKEQQELLNRAKATQLEMETRIFEIEQARTVELGRINEAERKASEQLQVQLDRKAAQKQQLLGGIDATLAEGDPDAKYALERERIAADYAEKIRLLEEYGATKNEIESAMAAKNREMTAATAKYEREVQKQRIGWLANTVSNMSGLMTTLNQMGLQNSREGFAAYKAFATAEALISTYSAATAAYKAGMEAGGTAGPALGAVFAAMAVAQGLAKVAMIVSAKPQGYAHGGLILGPDQGDRADNVTIRATPGEYMMDRPTVRHYGRGIMEALRARKIPKDLIMSFAIPSIPSPVGRTAYATGGDIAAPAAPVSSEDKVTVVNLFDMSEVGRFLATRAGEQTILNAVVNNPDVIKGVLA